jgi:hypothetical protein
MRLKKSRCRRDASKREFGPFCSRRKELWRTMTRLGVAPSAVRLITPSPVTCRRLGRQVLHYLQAACR